MATKKKTKFGQGLQIKINISTDKDKSSRQLIVNGEEKCDYNLEISLYEDEVSLDWIESLSPEDYEKCKFWLS